MYIIDPLPLFCSTFRCAIISYPCGANFSLYIGLEFFFWQNFTHTDNVRFVLFYNEFEFTQFIC